MREVVPVKVETEKVLRSRLPSHHIFEYRLKFLDLVEQHWINKGHDDRIVVVRQKLFPRFGEVALIGLEIKIQSTN